VTLIATIISIKVKAREVFISSGRCAGDAG